MLKRDVTAMSTKPLLRAVSRLKREAPVAMGGWPGLYRRGASGESSTGLVR